MSATAPPCPPMLHNPSIQTKDMDTLTWQYKLAGQGKTGLDIFFPDEISVDEGKMSMVLPFADGNRRDQVGDLLEIGGIDLERHKKNPVVLFDHGKGNHEFSSWPIALAIEPETKQYTVKLDPTEKKGICTAYFYQGLKSLENVTPEQNNEFARYVEQIFHLICKGFIRGGSIGYLVKAARELPADYQTGTPKGAHLLATLMLEASVVIIPANMDTVTKGKNLDCVSEILSMPTVCGKPLSPYLVKSLQTVVPEKKCQMSMGKTTAPVPLNDDLTKTNVPPAKWKPGAGATKSQIPGDLQFWKEEAQEKEHQNNEDEIKIGTKIIKREGSKWVLYSHHGRVLGRHDTKEGAIKQEQAIEANKSLRKKVWGSQPTVQTKSLDIRKKYRNSKGLRRKLKKSTPGSSIIYIHSKDLVKMKELADSKGVKFHHVNTNSSGIFKIKLTGDDGAMDHIASEFGRTVKFHSKSLEVNHNMPLKPKTKAMDETMPADLKNEDEIAPTGVASEVEPPESDEKYSAQVLRRAHEDFRLLLEHYDELIKPLEHEQIADLMKKVCATMVDMLDEIEANFKKHHPESKALEGVESDDKEESANPKDQVEENEEGESADSEHEERPTPKEALEGMETKDLREKYLKVIRDSYKKKGMEEESEEKHVCGKCKEEGKSSCSCDKKAMPEEEMQEEKPEEQEEMESEDKGLEDHHKTAVHEAKEFLGKVAESHSMSPEDCKEAYYHAKSLGGIAGAAIGTAVGGPVGGAIGGMAGEAMSGGDKDITGDEHKNVNDEELNPKNAKQKDELEEFPLEDDKGFGCHRKNIGSSAEFLKSLSEMEGGELMDEHREKALYHKSLLEKALSAAEEMHHAHKESEINEPGEIGEKCIEQAKDQFQQMIQLNNQMKNLLNVIKSK